MKRAANRPGHANRPLDAFPCTGAAKCWLSTSSLPCYAGCVALSKRRLLDVLSRTPFIDSADLALILGEPHTTVHRTLADLLADGIASRASHGTVHLPSNHRHYLTARGIREATEFLGFETASDFVRTYPMSREWLTLLIRRMDVVASVYRLASSLSPGIDGLRSTHPNTSAPSGGKRKQRERGILGRLDRVGQAHRLLEPVLRVPVGDNPATLRPG